MATNSWSSVVVGGGSFAGEIDNLRFMDGLLPTNALTTNTVRTLRTLSTLTSTSDPSKYHIKALFTFDVPEPYLRSATTVHAPGVQDVMSPSNIQQSSFAGTADKTSHVETTSFRGLPKPSVGSTQTIVTSSQSKPAKPSTMEIDENEIVSWHNTPMDYGGFSPTDASNSVVLCSGKTATSKECSVVWQGSSAQTLTPTAKEHWSSGANWVNDENGRVPQGC